VDPQKIGRYEIKRRLGKGGMGSLFLALDPRLDRLVAIKVLKTDYEEDPELRQRFAREARALARLRHQNIVTVYDFGEYEGRLFMAMEYIDGETLTHRLRRAPPLKLGERLELIEKLCAGLASAHDAGIVHRDIKPDNIMLDGSGGLKLLDFGIARHGPTESALVTQPGMMIGTYSYMSPEQLLGQQIDKRSDIFSIGAVLYEVIALAQAFPGAFGAAYHAILYTGPVSLEQLVPGIDPALARIVGRALHRDAELRYQNVTELGSDLLRVHQQIDAQSGNRSAEATIVRPAARTPSSQRVSTAQQELVAEQLRLGEAAYQEGNFEAALRYAERATVVDPNAPAAADLMNRAAVAAAAGSVRALLQKADSRLSAGLPQEALALTQQAMDLVPRVAEGTGLRHEVHAVADKAQAARDRAERVSALIQQARSAADAGRYDTALRVIDEALALDPTSTAGLEVRRHATDRQQIARHQQRVAAEARQVLERARAYADAGQLRAARELVVSISSSSEEIRREVAEALSSIDSQHRIVIGSLIHEAHTAAGRGDFERAASILAGIGEEDQTEESRAMRSLAVDAIDRRRRAEADVQAQRDVLSRESRNASGDSADPAAALDDGLTMRRIPPLPQQRGEFEIVAEPQRPMHAAGARTRTPRRRENDGESVSAVARDSLPAVPWYRHRLILAASAAAAVLVVAGAWFAQVNEESAVSTGARDARTEVAPPASRPPTGDVVPVSPSAQPAPAPAVTAPIDGAAAMRAEIVTLIVSGKHEDAERLIASGERRFGAASFRSERQQLAQLRGVQANSAVRDLLDRARREPDHSAAIAILKTGLELAPQDLQILAAIRDRTAALSIEQERRQAPPPVVIEQPAEIKSPPVDERIAEIGRAGDRIDDAVARGDLAGAERLLQAAEQQYGEDAFRTRRERVANLRTQAAAAAEEQLKTQIRAALDRFARAYSSEDRNALAAVWPAYPKIFADTFTGFDALSWQFGPCAIQVTGPVATASCDVAVTRVNRAGRTVRDEGSRRFTLRAQGGTWQIESMQVQ
jgi:tetratricopeptide (TPR) repeat protein